MQVVKKENNSTVQTESPETGIIDKSKKHVFVKQHEVIYFGKYDFGTEHIPYTELDEVYKRKHPKERVMAAAILALDFNDGEYVKKAGKYEFVDMVDDNDIPCSNYILTKMGNSAVMRGILTTYPRLITDSLLDKAKDIIAKIELDFMFKVLGDDMTEFEQSIANFLSTNEFDANQLGVCAYLPTYYTKEEDKKSVADRSISSKHFGDIGDRVELVVDILSTKFLASPQFGNPGYMVNGITDDDNRVSFFTVNEEIGKTPGVSVKINAKVKAHQKCFFDKDIDETKLNYVKLS